MNNDHNGIRQSLHLSGMKLRKIYDKIMCNDLTLIQFAQTKNAEKAGKYLVKKVSKKNLKNSKELEWAQANNFADSAITAAISDKLN
ncbi:DUF3718 domain-containing protein [Catenovulum sp. SM1970]|uniref:DUF3718 domain-containing protein n=1 Tax=Marinifaba aquimaris TaxID=2741323 RepID=UPI001572C05C|nr:DUF3718 domain-containing protein [Marinifaba aquimaris]NTS78133.1 DUF3718 domain-containing protein [Marinifaba aquimaris]